ncbi:hypothetical protein KFL_011770010, partial [Klebsormidium nitens]
FSVEQLELAKTSLKDGLGNGRGGDGMAHGEHCAPDADVEAYLAELVVGSHERAACEGPRCFCKQHPRVFGGADMDEKPCAARCCASAQTNGKRVRSEQGENSSGAGKASAKSGKRRTKSFWAAKGIETEGSNAATGSAGKAESETADEKGRGTESAPQVDDRNALSIPVCNICVCPSNVCTHGASRGAATVLPMEAEGVQLEVPKLVRPTDSWQVHDPEVSLLRRPVRVSELTARDFEELSAAESLSAPCPRGPPPCKTQWSGLWQNAQIYDLYWSQEVKLRIYCCACPKKHTVHFNGEALGLYAWTRGMVITQKACQILLRDVQNTGAAFSSLVAAASTVRRQFNPDATILSEECWRKATLGFFKLCGRQIMECCSLCGPHPEVLLCDGIAGLACADGTRQKGGLAGTDAALLRPFTAPSRSSNGVNVRKVMEAGSNYLAASLAGGGLKKRLLHQPELRTLLARFSGHHAADPELGKTLSTREYEELLVALARDDVQVVTDFVQDPDDADADPVLLHWRRQIPAHQVGQVRSKNKAVLELLDGNEREVMQDEPQWPPRCPHRWAELLYTLGAPFSVSDDSNLIQHGKALGVVRKLLLGGAANDDDRVVLAEHSPILRRLLDHYGDRFPRYFHPALHHLYRLTLFARGAMGLGVGRAGSRECDEEHRCRSGLTVGEFDAKVALESGIKKNKRLQWHTKGGFVFCCGHRVIYGFHVMLRGESPRDPFTVLYTRLNRKNLPLILVHDNACKLRAYAMRREPAFFADVRFLVDRFHFHHTTAEAHKCGSSYNTDYYDSVRWVNTSAVESCNAFLVTFKTQAWYSSLVAFMIILANLVSGRNSDLARVDEPKLRIAGRADTWSPAIRFKRSINELLAGFARIEFLSSRPVVVPDPESAFIAASFKTAFSPDSSVSASLPLRSAII